LESLSSLVINKTKGSIEYCAKTGLPGYLEEGELEAVGIVCVVEADYLWESLPHLDTVGECPDKAQKAVRLIWCPLHNIRNPFLIKFLK
jgi:hypothetical protein